MRILPKLFGRYWCKVFDHNWQQLGADTQYCGDCRTYRYKSDCDNCFHLKTDGILMVCKKENKYFNNGVQLKSIKYCKSYSPIK